MNADLQSFSLVFGFIAKCTLPFVLGALVAGIFAAVMQAATLIQDQVIGFVSKLAGVSLVGYLYAGTIHSQILEYARTLWSYPQYYQ